jgi:hypothetical protein
MFRFYQSITKQSHFNIKEKSMTQTLAITKVIDPLTIVKQYQQRIFYVGLTIVTLLIVNQSLAQSAPGTEEFGKSKEELVAAIEAVETGIASCMNDAGFEYVPVDYVSVREAMQADKTIAGLGEEEYAAQYGFGISTASSAPGSAPQRAGDSSIIQLGLGEQNVSIFNSLSEADQVAYNRSLLGESLDATFAQTLESEDFSQTGGCTRKAVEAVFSSEELNASYLNPKDILLAQDPRMVAAISEWSTCMRDAGFDYNNPEEIEPDLREQLNALTGGATPESLTGSDKDALVELQGAEKAIAVASIDCGSQHIEPVVQKIETELYGAPQQ